VDIGNQLREWREANGLSQSELEGRTGLVCSYISQVEQGHTLPTLPVLETWVKALGFGLYQVSLGVNERPKAPKFPKLGAQERNLLALFAKMPGEDKSFLISLAREMVKGIGDSEDQ